MTSSDSLFEVYRVSHPELEIEFARTPFSGNLDRTFDDAIAFEGKIKEVAGLIGELAYERSQEELAKPVVVVEADMKQLTLIQAAAMVINYLEEAGVTEDGSKKVVETDTTAKHEVRLSTGPFILANVDHGDVSRIKIILSAESELV